jgi:D-lactate dehydrogenase (cytochrome)
LEKLLFFRHAVPEMVDIIIDQRRKIEPTITLLSTDMAVPDEWLRGKYARYKEDLIASGLDYVIFGHVGENHLHACIFPKSKAEHEQGYGLYKKWAAMVRDMGGSATAEHGAGKMKISLVEIVYGQEKLEEMRRLKHLFDPENILCPGNILG